jgi:GNAT superfamily N-acetyltransferase
MDTNLTFSVHDDIPHDTGRLVDEGLGASNEEAAPLEEVERLACFARLPGGDLLGGAIGRTWGECCELQQLWVDRSHRRKGIGTRLVREFERNAAARGCRRFYLETFSFQAPALYLKLGYEVKLQIEGFPDGIVKYVMVREHRG